MLTYLFSIFYFRSLKKYLEYHLNVVIHTIQHTYILSLHSNWHLPLIFSLTSFNSLVIIKISSHFQVKILAEYTWNISQTGGKQEVGNHVLTFHMLTGQVPWLGEIQRSVVLQTFWFVSHPSYWIAVFSFYIGVLIACTLLCLLCNSDFFPISFNHQSKVPDGYNLAIKKQLNGLKLKLV